MDASADLRAAAHSRPGVHHRARADARADVHVAGHQDGAPRDEAAHAGDGRRHHTHAEGLEAGLDRDLVAPLERSGLHGFHALETEVAQNGLLHPRVDDPVAVECRGWRGHAQFTAVEQLDRFTHRTLHIVTREQCRIAHQIAHSSFDFRNIHYSACLLPLKPLMTDTFKHGLEPVSIVLCIDYCSFFE